VYFCADRSRIKARKKVTEVLLAGSRNRAPELEVLCSVTTSPIQPYSSRDPAPFSG
jgi:hypothetical protein